MIVRVHAAHNRKGCSLERNAKKRSLLLGVGFDGDDRHQRVSRGENFLLVGGSRETHEEMQDKAISFSSELRQRGRRLEEIDRDEFREIAQRCGMDVPADED